MIYASGKQRLIYDPKHSINSVADVIDRRKQPKELSSTKGSDFARVATKLKRTTEKSPEQFTRVMMFKDAALCSVFIRMFDEATEGSSTAFALSESIPLDYLRNEEVASTPFTTLFRCRQQVKTSQFIDQHKAENVF